MAKPTARITLLEVGLAIAVLGVTARAAYLQIVDHERRSEILQRTSIGHEQIPARRGAVLDRNGAPLAITNTYYHVGLAARELDSTAAGRTMRLVATALGEPLAPIRARAAAGKYIYFYGPYDASTVEGLQGVRGIHLESEQRRAYPAGALGTPIVGRLSPDSSTGISGIEKVLDSVLAGTAGEQVYLKAPGQRRLESPRRRVKEPVPGRNVVLTIDANLQEIAEHILDSTVRSYKALGGDLVVMDVRTGELLAAAGVTRDPKTEEMAPAPSFVTVPFEPGSTAKLFTAAALVDLGRVKSQDAVQVNGKVWITRAPGAHRDRTITDEHVLNGPVTLAEAIKVSSNIAMAKFSEKLTWGEQYDALRAFGFGTQSGLEATGEDRGRLNLPATWTGESPASHAMGYEFRLTSVQLAAAYATIANGGVLLSPALVREIRAPDGTVQWQRQTEPVRRAISRTTSKTLIKMLLAVTEGGTGVRAGMKTYQLAGKTGTANKFDTTCRCYRTNANIASFAAVFPAEEPQISVVMKVDSPSIGTGFGGGVSAPAVRSLLEQMLASGSAPVNRIVIMNHSTVPMVAVPASAAPVPMLEAADPSQTVALPIKSVPPSTAPVAVPDVGGRSVRDATTLLLRAGLRVSAAPGAQVLASTPLAGTRVLSGTLVSLRTN